MGLQTHKTTSVFHRPQGSIMRITCWATEDGKLVDSYDNCYLVEQGDLHFLIDTCRTLYFDLVVEECDKVGLDAILLTHGHFDHCQNTAALVERFGAKVALSGRDLYLLEDPASQPLKARVPEAEDFAAVAWPAVLRETIPPFKVDVVYGPVKSLHRELGIEATVFGTPGHTQGHVAIDLWNSDLFVGDILMNVGEPVPAMLCFDESAIDESVRRILAIEDDRTIHFGHGEEVAISDLGW